MAITFSIRLGKEGRNGRKVYIRCTYKRQSRDIPTSMYVTPAEVTRGGRIKNVLVLNRCEELISEYRQRAYKMGLELSAMDPRQVFDVLSGGAPSCAAGSFTAWASQWVDGSERKGTDNYIIALRAFHRFLGVSDIAFSQVNKRTLAAFAESLKDKRRAASLYCSAVCKIYNDAREQLEGLGLDFLGFKAPRQRQRLTVRALPLGVVRSIFGGSFDCVEQFVEQFGKNLDKSHLSGRAVLALDCWVISFSLMGMNSVDLYELEASQFDGQYITYCRHKTRERRQDSARMVVAVPSFLLPLFSKYEGTGGALFDFSARYATFKNFQIALNIGLKEVGAVLGVPALSFYSARHSFASIAVNVAGVDKYTVGEMLCHVDTAMRITDTYIAKDWGRLHSACAKVWAVVMSGAGMV